MALITDVEAMGVLRKLKEAYRGGEDEYDQKRVEAFDLADEVPGRDENFLVAPAAGNILEAYGSTGPAFDPALIAILRLFATNVIKTSSTDRDVLLAKLAKWMRENGKAIKSRGTQYDAIDQDPLGTKVGSQVLVMCSVMPDGTVNESATIENLVFECEQSATSRRGLGSENYSVRGEGIDGISEFQKGGRGIQDTRMKAYAPGVDSLPLNSSWDGAFQGSGANKIPNGWEIISGDTNVERVTASADIAQDRGANHGALRISGDCVLRYYFRKQGRALSRVRPYACAFRGKKAGTPSFDLDIAIGSSGATYPLDASYNQGNFTTSYADKVLDSNRRNAWADAFDEDGDPYIEIEVSGSTFGGSEYLYLDDFMMKEMIQVGGRYVAVVSGLTVAVKGDTMSQECRLDQGEGYVELTGGGSGSVDTLTAGGLALIDAAENFDTDLNTTAANLRDSINAKVTYPNYEAVILSATPARVYIRQEKPVSGTVAIAVTSTTITTAKSDISGGDIGEIADFIVRRTGLHLPHSGSPSTGYTD